MLFLRTIVLTVLWSTILLLIPSVSFAESVSLLLKTKASDDRLEVHVQNQGTEPATLGFLDGSLANRKFKKILKKNISPEEKHTFTLTLPTLKNKGSYPLLLTLHYQVDGISRTMVGAGVYNHQIASENPEFDCYLPKRVLNGSMLLPVQHSYVNPVSISLHTPQEIAWQRKRISAEKSVFELTNLMSNIFGEQTVFALISTVTTEGTPITHICSSTILVTKGSIKERQQSALPYFICTWLFLLFALLISKSRCSTPAIRNQAYILSRWTFSVAILCMAIALFFGLSEQIHLFLVSDLFLLVEKNFPVSSIMEEGTYMLSYLSFTAPAFGYFSDWLLWPILFYFVFLNYFVLRYLKKDLPENDKYWHLLLCVGKILSFKKEGQPTSCDYELAGQGARAVLVKYFFSPLLAGWLIQNIYHIIHLGNSVEFTFEQCITILIAGIILIDVLVFTFGYLTELPQLKNEIRSVDATFFGWFVCLACYPPLNQLLFRFFDSWGTIQLFPENQIIFVSAHVLIVLLWLLYVWATIALGFKASNLTNRGIVQSGPYAFIRHPAYTAKVSLWFLSCLLLSEKSIPLVLVLALLYFLRAKTEEQHLGHDPDYLAYKEKVPYMLVPGLV